MKIVVSGKHILSYTNSEIGMEMLEYDSQEYHDSHGTLALVHTNVQGAQYLEFARRTHPEAKLCELVNFLPN